jgi:hypothetical protein
MDLAPRIVDRTSRVLLEREIGIEATRGLVSTHAVAHLAIDSLLDLARDVARIARDRDTPVVFLKGIALHLTGRVRPGCRWACDVDALVPGERIEELVAALSERGFIAAPGVTCEHQWTPLRRPSGETVELHRFLPGVRLEGEKGFATIEDLESRGLIEPLPSLGAGVGAPDPTILAAHALAHGIAQHGFAPASYPMTRMLADLVDLGWGEEAHSRFRGAVGALTAGDVTEREAEATWDLCAVLRRGETLPSVIGQGPPDHLKLLAHVVAGALDLQYADALKLRIFGSGPSLLPRPLAFMRDAARSLWPNRAQVEALRGKPTSRFDMAVFRLARPFDLFRRAVRSTRSAAAAVGDARRH